jgi:hypothetical protein
VAYQTTQILSGLIRLRSLARGLSLKLLASLLLMIGLLPISGQSQTIGDPVNGGLLYYKAAKGSTSANCAGCHDAPPTATDGQRVYLGVDWTVLKAAFSKYPDMGKYLSTGSYPLSDVQVKDISAYICQSIGSTAKSCSAPTATPPLASLSPSSISAFANTQIGLSSAATVVTLLNTGGSTLTVASVTITGANSTDFTQTNNCSAGLAAATGQCKINISFKPSVTGARNANLVVTHNSGNVAGSTSQLALSGIGVAAPAPVMALDKSSLVFGSVLAGSSSPVQTITLSNSGNANLSLPSNLLSFTGNNASEFSATHNCSTILASLSSCSIGVTYRPISAGLGKTANLLIANTSGLPTLTVALTGDAINPVANLQTNLASVAFGNQFVGNSSTQGIVLTSNGSGPVVFSNPALSIGAGVFAASTNCSATLTIGASCLATVTFLPTAASSYNGTLTFNANTPAIKTLSLSGTGVAQAQNSPRLTISPSTGLVFSPQIKLTGSAAQALVLTNAGNSTLTVGNIALTGANAADYSLTTGSNACANSFALASAASCNVYVKFTPQAVGASAGVLSVSSDSIGGNSTVNLTGTGLAIPAPIALVSSNVVYFAGVAGSQSNAQTITLSNTGNADLTGSYRVSGAGAGDFVVASGVNSCSQAIYTLAANTACVIYVKYAPAATGNSNAALQFATNASVSPFVSLSGVASAVPTAVGNLSGAGAWPDTQIGTAGQTYTFTLVNSGNATLTLGAITVTGSAAADFKLDNGCAAAVGIGQSCDIRIAFMPMQQGLRDAQLQVSTNVNAQPLQINLQGTGSSLPAVTPPPTAPSASAPTQSGAGGGCAAGDPTQGVFDPMLWLFIVVSAWLAYRRRAVRERLPRSDQTPFN